MCSRTRTNRIIVGLALVVLPVACAFSYEQYVRRYIAYVIPDVLYFALWFVVPVTVLVINVLLVREVRRASNAAASLGLHHQSTSSSSAVPTVMVIATSLVYAFLRGTTSILWLAAQWTGRDSLYMCYGIASTLCRICYAYNFYVYVITGKQFRSDLRTLFCRCSSSSSASASSSAANAAAVVVSDRNDARLAGKGQAADSGV